jgi:hypothetical protein
MTPAEELRAAAKAMRERAETVQPHYPAPWVTAVWDSRTPPARVVEDAEGVMVVGRTPALNEFIAGMHPGVALAVADLLDKIAWMGEMDPDQLHRVGCDEAIAIARAYLGASPELAAGEQR